MTWKVAVKDQVKLQMEITNYCNAACSACAREWVNKPYKDEERNKSPYRWKLNDSYVDLETFKSWLDKDDWTKLEKIFFCGNYDEPATNPDLIPICKWIINSKDLFPSLPSIAISSNGGTRNEKFWSDLGKLSKDSKRIRVNFAIDGFSDTNHLYRVNVNWKILQRNYRAYLKAGGLAWWQFIIFKHNEHEVNLVEEYAKNEGFEKVKFIGSVRPSTEVVSHVKDKKANPNPTYTKVVPACYKTKKQEHGLFISHNGVISPCCWIATKAGLSDVWLKNKGDYTESILNGSNSIQEIFDSQWFSQFRKNMESGNFSKCSEKCKMNNNNTQRFEELQ